MRGSAPPALRATALALAGDAAYGMKRYGVAADRYRQVLQSDELPPEASHAALALGWAELRLGRRDGARLSFLRVTRQFPADARAPIALVLTAELAAQAGETIVARKFLDRVLESYPSSPEAEIARLSRSVVAMREDRPQDAARDLRVLLQSARASLPQDRARVLRGLAGAATAERHFLMTNQYGQPVAASNGPAPGGEPAMLAGAPDRFERFAAPFLDGAGDPETSPRVLHGLVLVAVEDKAWPDVQALSRHLVERFPGYSAAPELLGWVAARASSGAEWPTARSSYEELIARYHAAPLPAKARVDFAEALFRTGAPAQARAELTAAVKAGVSGPDAPRALHMLAAVAETLGEPRAALAAYERLRREHPDAEWTALSRLPHARLLQDANGSPQRTRALLEEVAERAGGDERTEASFRLGQLLAGAGDHGGAVDWFMAAAYDSHQPSRWYRPALLGAGRSLVALRRAPAAVAVYRSLLPAMPGGAALRDGVPPGSVEEPELAAEAAFRIAEIAREAGRRAEAADMYLAAAHLAPESPRRERALVEAIRALVAIGDRASAERVSRMLVESGSGAVEVPARAGQAPQPHSRAPSRNGR